MSIKSNPASQTHISKHIRGSTLVTVHLLQTRCGTACRSGRGHTITTIVHHFDEPRLTVSLRLLSALVHFFMTLGRSLAPSSLCVRNSLKLLFIMSSTDLTADRSEQQIALVTMYNYLEEIATVTHTKRQTAPFMDIACMTPRTGPNVAISLFWQLSQQHCSILLIFAEKGRKNSSGKWKTRNCARAVATYRVGGQDGGYMYRMCAKRPATARTLVYDKAMAAVVAYCTATLCDETLTCLPP